MFSQNEYYKRLKTFLNHLVKVWKSGLPCVCSAPLALTLRLKKSLIDLWAIQLIYHSQTEHLLPPHELWLHFTLLSNRVEFFCGPVRKRKKMTSGLLYCDSWISIQLILAVTFSILLLWLWWQELINSAIFTKFYFPKIAAIQEKTLACVKVAFRQKNYKYFTK